MKDTAGELPPSGSIIAIDWGTRRIGVAASDPSQVLAEPLGTITRRTGKRFPMNRLRRLIEDRDPVGFLVGLPLDAEGNEGESAQAARELGSLIREKTELPVVFVDERMSTARVLSDVRAAGLSARDAGDVIDALSAQVLLQGFLDSRKRPRS